MENNKLPYHSKPGFKVPENYFEDLEDRLMLAVQEEKDLPESLQTLRGKPGFVVPEGYFENIEEILVDRVTRKPGKLIQFISTRKLFYAAAVAAVFIGIISTVYFKSNTEEYTMDSIELSALENYIEEGYFDLDFNELSSFMTEDGYSFGNYSTDDFSDEAMYNYIDENIENPEFLFE